MKTNRVLLLFLFLALALLQTIHATASGPVALVLTIDGAITPATQEYLVRGIQTAERSDIQVLILQLNTPGGGLTPMQAMAEAIRASWVPVVVYVAPRGAWAGSAGTIITLAGHAAAMAPETAIGAASPVGSQGQDLGTTEQAKTIEIMKATVRTLAERRGPEAVALAEATIESAKAVSASEALNAHLVDFIANDISDLLKQLDGFTVQMSGGPLVLHTSGANSADPTDVTHRTIAAIAGRSKYCFPAAGNRSTSPADRTDPSRRLGTGFLCGGLPFPGSLWAGLPASQLVRIDLYCHGFCAFHPGY